MLSSTQPHEQVNDLVVFAANLRVACDLCARVAPSDEIVSMRQIFERQMVEKLRSAAELLSSMEALQTPAPNEQDQKSEPSPAA